MYFPSRDRSPAAVVAVRVGEVKRYCESDTTFSAYRFVCSEDDDGI